MLMQKVSAQKFVNRVAAKHSSEQRRPEQSYAVDPTDVVFQTDWMNQQDHASSVGGPGCCGENAPKPRYWLAWHQTGGDRAGLPVIWWFHVVCVCVWICWQNASCCCCRLFSCSSVTNEICAYSPTQQQNFQIHILCISLFVTLSKYACHYKLGIRSCG